VSGTTTTISIGNYFEWTVTEAPTATMKTYYYAGAIRIAMRTDGGDPQWLLGDHLGSTGLVYDGEATVRQGYMPWGEMRFVDGAGELPTTFRYTGQREEEGIGLYFYGARWYDAALGRFVSADTMVPGPGNTLAFDRYSYVMNNPLRYSDPSGYKACDNEFDDDCKGGYGGAYYDMTFEERLPIIIDRYNIELRGNWSLQNMLYVYKAVIKVGMALARQASSPISASAAFNAVYNATAANPVVFQWGNCRHCMGGGGYTYGARSITFASLSTVSAMRAINNIIHELGHAFDWAMKETVGENNMPRNLLNSYWKTNPFPRRPMEYNDSDGGYYGLAGPRNVREWHQNPSGDPNEEFADTFLAWASDAWETNSSGASTIGAQDRINFMNAWMSMYVNTGIIQ
jgi:RHS repeat-associated protein